MMTAMSLAYGDITAILMCFIFIHNSELHPILFLILYPLAMGETFNFGFAFHSATLLRITMVSTLMLPRPTIWKMRRIMMNTVSLNDIVICKAIRHITK